MKVLIIDDSPTVRKTAENFIKPKGHELIQSENGLEALALVVEHNPDIVFIDIMMPRLDGYQACAIIKGNDSYKHIPVIMLSSKDGIFDRARGKISGCNEFLTKPFTKDEMLEVINKYENAGAN